jgi:hypothetical protein
VSGNQMRLAQLTTGEGGRCRAVIDEFERGRVHRRDVDSHGLVGVLEERSSPLELSKLAF